ncbi:MAG: phosphate acyltransferase PlsX [Planctomycetota bacterium]|nr:MAG: phosphate acyltransferase PlsX [Planctomycetota bacterium]
MRVAIDAMGGDRAPTATVEGAVLATGENIASRLVLVGDKEALEAELKKHSDSSGIEIVHASQTVEMHESPAESLRKKRDSSIVRAVKLLKEGEVDAVISAGNTGAFVAAATLYARTLEGVHRPGIAAPLPNPSGGRSLLIDVGANIYCKPLHLVHYGIMAASYARHVFGISEPKVGLLNIGEETEKGNVLVKETNALFAKTNLNFVGNVEGQDVYRGVADVFVAEGFVGNTILKVSEGLGEMLLSFLKHWFTDAGAMEDKAVRGALGALFSMVDYAEYGGAPLLGISGLCIICHGRSDAKAILNAVRVATRYTSEGVHDEIATLISSFDGESSAKATGKEIPRV